MEKNFLCLPHRKLSAKEVEELCENYQLDSVMKLPKILKTDKAIKDLEKTTEEEVAVGDVIEIERDGFTGKTKYYRVVVE